MRLIIFIVISLTVGTSAGMAEGDAIAFRTFGDLKVLCESNDSASRAYCAGVVAGTIGTMSILRPNAICPPADTSLEEFTNSALSLLDSASDFADMSDTEGLTYGLFVAYSC